MPQKITVAADGTLDVPDEPIIPFIRGDGTGVDIWPAAQLVLDAAVAKRGKRIEWMEVLAGQAAFDETGSWLPDETVAAFQEYVVGIKGPLTTPVGGGIRSLNVALRQMLDLYACVRPVRWFEGVPSPVKHPEWVDVVIFRENSEDIYMGLEHPSLSPEPKKLIEFVRKEFGWKVRDDAGVGLKPMTPFGTKRLVRKAIRFALDHGRRGLTIVHKGNIMKYTEGAFREWGYEVAREEFGDVTITWDEVSKRHNVKVPPGRLLIQDYIADVTFQHLLTRPRDFDIIATGNLNGDYLSDAVAAQVGGIGM